MADNDVVKITPSLLAMDDIAELLKFKYDFMKNTEQAPDVEKVAGILSELIAVAVDASDRTTVRNALNLGDRPAGDYLTRDEGGEIINDSQSIKTIYSEELRALRDEVYQLRQELAKRGVVTGYRPYAGYYDLFRSGAPEHLHGIIASSIADSLSPGEIIVQDDQFKEFDEGDWIVLHIKNEARYHVAMVTAKMPDGQTLEFTPTAPCDLRQGQVDVYKSLGEIVDGAFCFFKRAEILPDSKEMYSCLDDDTFRLRRQIKRKHTGYGCTFRIPETQKGFFVRFDIQAKTYGAPGALMCYIIDEQNIGDWKNPTQAERDGILLARSQPLVHDASYGERIVGFEFWDGTQFPLLNEPDTVDRKVRYCAIVEALDADDDNYYDLVFLQNKQSDGTMGDLQLNNLTFAYEQKEDSSLDDALKSSDQINAADLYYGLTTRGVVNYGFTPHREAVYSARFKTQAPVEISRARATLRINREGYYVTNLPSGIDLADRSSLPVKKEASLAFAYDMSELGGFGLRREEEDVIIGTEIRRILNQNATSIVLAEGLHVKPDQPVYRAGYALTLKAQRMEWDSVACIYKITDQAKIPLTLRAVMPDQRKKDPRISDRLIYEGEFVTEALKPRYFNSFELQVHWHTEYSGMYEDVKYKADFVGKIHDIVVSMDKGI